MIVRGGPCVDIAVGNGDKTFVVAADKSHLAVSILRVDELAIVPLLRCGLNLFRCFFHKALLDAQLLFVIDML